MASRSTHYHQSENHSTTPMRLICMTGFTSEKDRAAMEGICRRLKQMGFLPGDAPSRLPIS